MKQCRRCAAEKPEAEFHPNPRYKDGMSSWCRTCHATRSSEWAKENRVRLTQKAVGWRESNRETARATNRAFKARNAVALKVEHSAWVAANRDKRRLTDAKRKAAKLMATPAWADKKAIAEIYRLCVAAEKQTGQRMHVDHIVPLQSDMVCGLHCEANLQILPGSENESKRNVWWPEMAIEQAQRQGDLFRDAAN